MEEKDPTLFENILELTSVLYDQVLQNIVYPFFIIVFLLFVIIAIVFLIFSFKKFLQYNFSSFIKYFTFSLVTIIIALNSLLVAFGKFSLYILYLKLQKDIFFIFISTLIGILVGKILFGLNSKKKILP
jgi:hypothetical protein